MSDKKDIGLLVAVLVGMTEGLQIPPRKEGFEELCSFAEDLGYEKVNVDNEGILYRHKNGDEITIPYPSSYKK